MGGHAANVRYLGLFHFQARVEEEPWGTNTGVGWIMEVYTVPSLNIPGQNNAVITLSDTWSPAHWWQSRVLTRTSPVQWNLKTMTT